MWIRSVVLRCRCYSRDENPDETPGVDFRPEGSFGQEMLSITVRVCTRKGVAAGAPSSEAPELALSANPRGFLEARSAPATPWSTSTIEHGHFVKKHEISEYLIRVTCRSNTIHGSRPG